MSFRRKKVKSGGSSAKSNQQVYCTHCSEAGKKEVESCVLKKNMTKHMKRFHIMVDCRVEEVWTLDWRKFSKISCRKFLSSTLFEKCFSNAALDPPYWRGSLPYTPIILCCSPRSLLYPPCPLAKPPLPLKLPSKPRPLLPLLILPCLPWLASTLL